MSCALRVPFKYATLNMTEVGRGATTAVCPRRVTFQYYDQPFCRPKGDKLKHKPETLGEVVDGNRCDLTLLLRGARHLTADSAGREGTLAADGAAQSCWC